MKVYTSIIVLLLSVSISFAQPINGIMYAHTSVDPSVFQKPYALNIPEVNNSIMNEGVQRGLPSLAQEVEVSVLVDEDGNYQFHQVRQSLAVEKRMILQNQLPELIFVPAKLRGEGVEAWITIKVKV